jgi:hypothetical protein
MAAHLIRKLEQFTMLSTADKQALDELGLIRPRRLSPRDDIIREGDKPKAVSLILEGWHAATRRSKMAAARSSVS